MSQRIQVGVIFGGKSAEHEVSLQSAKNIIESLDKERFIVVPIGISKEGRWYTSDEVYSLLTITNPKNISLRIDEKVKEVVLSPSGELLTQTGSSLGRVDVFFPVLHGPLGEDGTIQGLFKLANIPFVGPDVLGSAIGMDKDVMKRLLQAAGIPVARYSVYTTANRPSFTQVESDLGLPFFIKPANMGSSVGINKVKKEEEFVRYCEEAFRFDHKIVIEEAIVGRELECAVLGNETPKASLLGEVVVRGDEFYSYTAKYISEHSAEVVIPAELPPNVMQKGKELAIRTFQVLCLEGMARVDFFLRNEELLVNEVNTIPGFTNISMYPKLWEASGLSYTDLLTELIDLACERFQRQQKLESSYS